MTKAYIAPEDESLTDAGYDALMGYPRHLPGLAEELEKNLFFAKKLLAHIKRDYFDALEEINDDESVPDHAKHAAIENLERTFLRQRMTPYWENRVREIRTALAGLYRDYPPEN